MAGAAGFANLYNRGTYLVEDVFRILGAQPIDRAFLDVEQCRQVLAHLLEGFRVWKQARIRTLARRMP